MMFIELITTIFAGLGGVGIILWLRLMTVNRIPKWCIPAAAGLTMLGYQIVTEYGWFSHQRALLSNDVEVVSHVENGSWWRPWSLFVPQTLRFIAADFGNAEKNQLDSQLFKVDLYVVERRQPTIRMITVIHCSLGARADYSLDLNIPLSREELSPEWFPLSGDDRLLLVCP